MPNSQVLHLHLQNRQKKMQKQYTIIRTPKYYRYKENSKKKVLAKKPENPTVTLIENNSGNSWDKKNGADDKIIDIVGLNKTSLCRLL